MRLPVLNMVPAVTSMSGPPSSVTNLGLGRTFPGICFHGHRKSAPGLIYLPPMRYFRKFESFRPHPDYPSVDANVRGKTGPVQVGFFNTVSVWCDHFIRACLSVGIPANPDFDGAELNPIGVGRVSIVVVASLPELSHQFVL